MNTLQAQRAALQTVLTTAGLTVRDHLPERIVPPLALIAAGSPYVESAETYGAWTLRHTIVLVCAPGPNETTTDALDALVTAALVALDGADWGIERVDQPQMLAHGNANFLSTTIDVRSTVDHISDGEGP